MKYRIVKIPEFLLNKEQYRFSNIKYIRFYENKTYNLLYDISDPDTTIYSDYHFTSNKLFNTLLNEWLDNSHKPIYRLIV